MFGCEIIVSYQSIVGRLQNRCVLVAVVGTHVSVGDAHVSDSSASGTPTGDVSVVGSMLEQSL